MREEREEDQVHLFFCIFGGGTSAPGCLSQMLSFSFDSGGIF